MKFEMYKTTSIAPYKQEALAITTGGQWDGKGNCCGWYGIEYIMNSTVYGYIIGNNITIFPEPQHIKQLAIISIYSPDNFTVNCKDFKELSDRYTKVVSTLPV